MIERDAEQDQHRLDEAAGEIGGHQSPAPLRRVEHVAQRIADQVEGQRQQQDRGAGEEHQPGRRLEVGLVLEDDVAPGRRRRLHADAEKGQRRLEQHRGRDAERAPDDAWSAAGAAGCAGTGCAAVPAPSERSASMNSRSASAAGLGVDDARRSAPSSPARSPGRRSTGSAGRSRPGTMASSSAGNAIIRSVKRIRAAADPAAEIAGSRCRPACRSARATPLATMPMTSEVRAP